MNALGLFVLDARRAERPLAQSLERRRILAYLIMIFGDTAAIFGSFSLAGWLYQGDLASDTAVRIAKLLVPLFLVIAVHQRVYSAEALRNVQHARLRAVQSLLIASGAIVLLIFYLKTSALFSRATFTLGVITSGIAIAVFRAVVCIVVKNVWGGRTMNVLVLHDGGPAIAMDAAYYIDAAEHQLDPHTLNAQGLDHLGRYLRNMERVIVSCPVERQEAWAFILRGAGVKGELVSESVQQLGALGLEKHDHFTSLVIAVGPRLQARASKRVFDVVIAAAALTFLSPVFLLAALAIRLEDGGPIFFTQTRVGRGNCLFRIYKFRSMRCAQTDYAGSKSASRDDDRVTKVGRFLRRTSIDELPQLFNVLLGEMSIAGPRPHALGSLAGQKLFWEVDKLYWHRHSLRPGLTGLAQVRGFRGATENETDLTERLGADLEYIATWSPWRDIWIILRTVRVLVHDRAF